MKRIFFLAALALIATPAAAQTERCTSIPGTSSGARVEGSVIYSSENTVHVVRSFPCMTFSGDKWEVRNGKLVERVPIGGASGAADVSTAIAEAERRGWNAARAAVVIPPPK